MEISKDYPPNWKLIQVAFPDCERYKPVFSFGGVLYNPFGVAVTKDLEYHEIIHARQQGSDPDGWWNLYMADRAFRLEQEVEAYGNQLAFFKRFAQNGKLTEWLKKNMADALSSEPYGNLCTFHEAEGLIKRFAKSVIL